MRRYLSPYPNGKKPEQRKLVDYEAKRRLPIIKKSKAPTIVLTGPVDQESLSDSIAMDDPRFTVSPTIPFFTEKCRKLNIDWPLSRSRRIAVAMPSRVIASPIWASFAFTPFKFSLLS